MAIRLKDRIEANIRQSDKVNNDLKIYLQGSNTTYLYTYNGGEARSVYIHPDAIGALPTSGGTMTGILELAGTGPWYSIRRSLEIQRKTTSETYKEGYTWTETNSEDSTKVDTNVLGENNDGFHIYTYYTPPYGYTKTYPDGSSGTWVHYGIAALRMQSINHGTGNFSDYYTEYRLPTNRAGLTSNITNYFNTSYANIGGVNKPVYVSDHGRLLAGNTFVPTSGGTFSGTVYFDTTIVKYGRSGFYTYIDYYRKNNAGTAGETDGYTWASGNTGAWIAWTGYAIGGVETNGTETKSYSTYWATRAYSINSTTGARLSYHYTFRLPAIPNDLTESTTRYIASSSSLSRGGSNQPVYLSSGYLYTCNTFVPNSGGEFTGTVVFSKTTDAAPDADNGPALVIGGTRTTSHIEIDNNEIIAKSDGKTESTLNLGAGGGTVSINSNLSCAKTVTIASTTTCKNSIYIRRAPNSSCTIYFKRAPNPSTTTWTSSDGVYTYTIDKDNGEVDMAYLTYSPSWAGKRVTVADGTTNNSYVSNGYLSFRNYSISSSTGARLSYYYQFRLYPATPADLTANTTFYFAVHTNSSISASTAKRYVVGISGANGGLNYNSSVYTSGSVLYGACWNDYAEYRKTTHTKPGRVVVEKGDGSLCQSWDRLLPGCEIVSDTYGFAIGETEECKTPIAVSGRVLAYPYENRESYQPGDAVCSAPGGCVSRMTRQEITMYPERIIGTVSEIPDYDTWGEKDVKVDGRIWIRIR